MYILYYIKKYLVPFLATIAIIFFLIIIINPPIENVEKDNMPFCAINHSTYGSIQECPNSISGYQWRLNNTTVISIDSTTATQLGIIDGRLEDKILYVNTDDKFEIITAEQLKEKQRNKEVCYTAEDAWDNIGQSGCVAYWPSYMNQNSGIIFLSENKNYREGFQAVLKGNFISYDDVNENFFTGRGSTLLYVDGEIARYEGHPEIEVWNSRSIGIATIVGAYEKNGKMIYIAKK